MIGKLFARLIGRGNRDAAAEIDRLQAEIEALRRLGAGSPAPVSSSAERKRGKWRKAVAAHDPRWRPSDRGRQASFTYVDVDGVVTDRFVSNWSSEGAYIKGFCLDRRATRTFRKDRIEDWRGAL